MKSFTKTSSAGQSEIDAAVEAARAAAAGWAGLPLTKRIEHLQAFKAELTKAKESVAQTISQETGKPLWESKTEVDAMIGKVGISVEAQQERCAERRQPLSTGLSITRHKPHGVVAVFGPFNFPGHLPNGHIVPALLAGNTVVFKPSELAPGVGQLTFEIWQRSGLPTNVFNLVQGGRETGELLARHLGIDGLFFTGSANTGRALLQIFSEQPQKILALEMGGNNPLIIDSVSDPHAAAYLTVQSAFITSGQRCSCARRLIVINNPSSESFLKALLELTKGLQVGRYDESPEPFMGPVINEQAAQRLLNAQADLIRRGAKPLVEMRQLDLGPAFLSPGILDVTPVTDRIDEEFFGPLLQVIRVNSLNEAIAEANSTRYGLVAGLIGDSEEAYQRVFNGVRAGLINWNAPLTGASSAMPFGGLGWSGNHRPSAFYAADYCAYPVASTENTKHQLPSHLLPGIPRI